jgi:hypothetical protein
MALDVGGHDYASCIRPKRMSGMPNRVDLQRVADIVIFSDLLMAFVLYCQMLA